MISMILFLKKTIIQEIKKKKPRRNHKKIPTEEFSISEESSDQDFEKNISKKNNTSKSSRSDKDAIKQKNKRSQKQVTTNSSRKQVQSSITASVVSSRSCFAFMVDDDVFRQVEVV